MVGEKRARIAEAYITKRLAAEKAAFERWWIKKKPKNWDMMGPQVKNETFREAMEDYTRQMTKLNPKDVVPLKPIKGVVPKKLKGHFERKKYENLESLKEKDWSIVEKEFGEMNKRIAPSSRGTADIGIFNMNKDYDAAGFYNRFGNNIAMKEHGTYASYEGTKDYFRNTLWHESGHAIESQNFNLTALRQQYMKKRVPKGTTFHEERTAKGTLIRYYHANGIEPYTFGEYAGNDVGAEWASTGFDWMERDPQKLLKRDPDHFYWMLMVMRGVGVA